MPHSAKNNALTPLYCTKILQFH